MGEKSSPGEMDMNEGTVAMLIQWCTLCLVWMGSLDRLARALGMSRRRLLAVIAGFLLSSFANWTLAFAPVTVSVSGTLLPLLACAWLYGHLPYDKRRICLVAAGIVASFLFWLRWLFFNDPVLLVWDERVLLPAAAVILVMMVGRNPLPQLFALLLSQVLSDAIHAFFFWRWAKTCQLGSPYAQDLLWSGLSYWMLVCLVWLTAQKKSGWNNAEPSGTEDV